MRFRTSECSLYKQNLCITVLFVASVDRIFKSDFCVFDATHFGCAKLKVRLKAVSEPVDVAVAGSPLSHALKHRLPLATTPLATAEAAATGLHVWRGTWLDCKCQMHTHNWIVIAHVLFCFLCQCNLLRLCSGQFVNNIVSEVKFTMCKVLGAP